MTLSGAFGSNLSDLDQQRQSARRLVCTPQAGGWPAVIALMAACQCAAASAAHTWKHTMSSRFSETAIWVRLTGAIWLMLVLAWGSLIAWETHSNRRNAVEQAKEFASTINEMTMAGL